MDKQDYSQQKSFCTAKEAINGVKSNLHDERKHLQTIYLIRSHFLKYMRSTSNLIAKKKKRVKYLSRHFFKEDIPMTKRNMKNCSVSLIIKEL